MKKIDNKTTKGSNASVMRVGDGAFFGEVGDIKFFEPFAGSKLNDGIDNQLKIKAFKSSYELWKNSSMAKELLARFENGHLKNHKLVFKKIGHGKNAQGLTSIDAEVQIGDTVEILPLKNKKKIIEVADKIPNISRFIITVEIMDPLHAGIGAAVLNHEIFLWVIEAANIIENYETTHDKDKLIELLIEFNSENFITERYGEIFKEDSLLQLAHKELISNLENEITTAKIAGDDKRVSEFKKELDYLKEAIQEEKDFHDFRKKK